MLGLRHAELRRIAHDLQPDVLDGNDLKGTVPTLVERWSSAAGDAGPRFEADVAVTSLPDHVSRATYRILGEALTNVARHADATACSVTVRADNLALLLTVRDDGRGVSQPEHTGTGFTSMRTRAQRLGGTLDIGVAVPTGTTLTTRTPLVDLGG